MSNQIPWTKEIIEEQKQVAEKASPRPWWLGEKPGTMEESGKFMAEAAAFYPESQMLYMVGAGPIPENNHSDGSEPCLIPAITGNGPTSEANRNFIVEAVNNYIPALEKIEQLNSVLQTVMDAIDYTTGNCGLTEMVGAVLPRELITNARNAMLK